MKVSESDKIGSLQAYIQNTKNKAGVEDSTEAKKSASKPVEEQKSSGSEIVSLSGRAKEMQKIEKALEKIPDIREEKVAKIREEIEKGNYKIKGNAIAAKMIRESILDELL